MSSEPAQSTPAPASAAAPGASLDRTVNRVMLRLIPFIVALYVCNYLDRVNVAFAKLTMNADLGFSETAYGWGAGIFFVSYFLFEVPSNLVMERVGARLWLARIMITWGLISSAMMFVRGEWSFYILRFLLGAAEAGFAPGILLYLTYWIPVRQQARAVAWFLTSTAIAGLLGSPLAGALLGLSGHSLFGHTLAGWQWLFFLEGIPSVIGGVLILLLLPNRPENARWLSAAERDALTGYLQAERADRARHGHVSFRQGMSNPRVWLLSVNYCLVMFAFQGLNFWLATIIKEALGLKDNLHVGLLTAVPYAAAVVAMITIGKHSDSTGERRWHAALCALAGAAALGLCAATGSAWLAYAALIAAGGAIWSILGPFWALPPTFLAGTAAAAGIALINSVGNLGGGFVGQSVLGALKDHTGSYRAGLMAAAGGLVVSAALALSVRAERK